jgi:hypothetical protein
MRLFCAVLICSLPTLAAEPFTGTWKEDITAEKYSGKPTRVELMNGTYKCLSCNPPITMKADGKDQPWTMDADPGIDRRSMRIVDDHSIETAFKMAEKVLTKRMDTVSPDGMTKTSEYITYRGASDKPVISTSTMKRVGKPIAGAHLISGSWVPDKTLKESENGLLVTYEQTADGLKMTAPTGEHYEAKFDGKEYPVSGSAAPSRVILKRVNSRIIEKTDKNGTKVAAATRMTVSVDGRTITAEYHDTIGVFTSVFRKQ